MRINQRAVDVLLMIMREPSVEHDRKQPSCVSRSYSSSFFRSLWFCFCCCRDTLFTIVKLYVENDTRVECWTTKRNRVISASNSGSTMHRHSLCCLLRNAFHILDQKNALLWMPDFWFNLKMLRPQRNKTILINNPNPSNRRLSQIKLCTISSSSSTMKLEQHPSHTHTVKL